MGVARVFTHWGVAAKPLIARARTIGVACGFTCSRRGCRRAVTGCGRGSYVPWCCRQRREMHLMVGLHSSWKCVEISLQDGSVPVIGGVPLPDCNIEPAVWFKVFLTCSQ